MHLDHQQQQPILAFEFADVNGKRKPYLFQNPHKIITTSDIQKVVPCLKEVEEEIQKGYYAAGFLTYESAPAFDHAYLVKAGNRMPLLWFGIFTEPLNQNLLSDGEFTITQWKASVSEEDYHTAIKRVKEYIRKGDTYQTNYTLRLHADFKGDTIAFYQQLKKAQNSNYCVYIDTGEHAILSASPELFFRVDGTKVTTRPMKGTIARGNTLEEDQKNKEYLLNSEKERAENVMIVDLLRNDLGIISNSGSVKVTQLMEVETYPTVLQMTSTIQGNIPESATMCDVFRALFPCGSITGAPKISTMKIIEELETETREVYCGAIGYITPKKEAVFNVPIRTVMIDKSSGEATYGVGGGITWDSKSSNEYEEVIAKANILKTKRPEFQILESLLLENGEYFLLEEHLRRMKNSAQYFQYPLSVDLLQIKLNKFKMAHEVGQYKVRCLLNQAGAIHVEGASIQSMLPPFQIRLANKPIQRNNPFLYHKTTNRTAYAESMNAKPSHIYDILFWNEEEELMEFSSGNVVIDINGVLYTPPVTSGLLRGTYREALIKSGKVVEKVIKLEDLKQRNKLWFINSVRKWREVELVDEDSSSQY